MQTVPCCPIRFQSRTVLGEQVDGPWACGFVPRGCAVAVTPMCQGGAGATGDSQLPTSFLLMQCCCSSVGFYSKMMKGIFVKSVGDCDAFCILGLLLKSHV